jgi:MFS family permease
MTSSTAAAATGTMRAALRHPHFRRLLLGLGVSQAGDWLYNVALLAFVFDRTHSSAWMSATTAARVLPIVVLGPLGGVLADRFDRRRLMIGSDLVRAACMLALAAIAVGGLTVVLAPVLAGLATAAAAPYAPCVAATTPRLVRDEDLPGANAARSVLGPVCIIAGPALGSILLLLGSPTLAFVLNAGTFLVSALAIAAIPAGPVFAPAARIAGAPRASVLSDMKSGARALRRHPDAMRLVGADLLGSVVYGVETVLLLLVSRRLGLGEAGYGYLLSGMGLGGVLAPAIAARVSRARRPHVVLAVAMASAGLPLPLLALSPSLAVALATMVCGGAGGVLVEVMAETTLMRVLDEDVFALAYGFAYPAAIAGIVIGSVIAAPLAALLGLSGALTLVGLCVFAYAVTLLRPARAAATTQPAIAAPALDPVAA